MSVNHQSMNSSPSYAIYLPSTLAGAKQHTITSLLRLLPPNVINDIQTAETTKEDVKDTEQTVINIKDIVDGRNLACPMPLLKTKVALRRVANGESLYVVATDPNSQADIAAFCQQTRQAHASEQLLLAVNQTSEQQSNDSTLPTPSDTIFHFIITKTDSI